MMRRITFAIAVAAAALLPLGGALADLAVIGYQQPVSHNFLNGLVESTDLVTDLRNFTGTATQAGIVSGTGSEVYARGLASINDGQGGLYYWLATSSASDDGFSVIKPTAVPGAGRWLRATGINYAASNAALQALPSGAGSAVRLGYGAPGDGPPLSYVASSAPCTTTSFTGAISGNTLTVSAISAGTISVGAPLSGAGVVPGTYITAPTSGAISTTGGGVGSYRINTTLGSISSEAMALVGDAALQVPTADGKCWLAQIPDNTIDVRWFGVFPGSATDPAPMLNLLMGEASGHTIFFPPGTYTCKSNYFGYYPVVVSFGCVVIRNQSNFKIEGPGAILTMANGVNASAGPFEIVDSDHFDIGDLHFLANMTGLGSGAETFGIQLQYVSAFALHDLYWDGDWGGAYGSGGPFGAGISGAQWSDGALARLRMPKVTECFDVAFLQRVNIRDNYFSGSNGAGGSSPYDCIHLERDSFTAAYTQAKVTPTNGDILIAGNAISGFQAAAHISLGQRIQIVGNDFHDNPGPTPITTADLPAGMTAGVILNYYGLQTAESFLDPPNDITIANNVFGYNGNGTNTGAGVLIATADLPAGSETSSGNGTIAAAGSGYVVTTINGYPTVASDFLTAAGGTCSKPMQILPLTVDGSGHILTYAVFAQGTCSSPPANPISFTGGSGSGFQLNATWVAPLPIQNVSIAGNVCDNNNPNCVAATSANWLGNLTIGPNALAGASQSTPYNAAALGLLGPGTSSQGVAYSCAPQFNPATSLTAYCGGGLESTGEMSMVAAKAGLFAGLQVSTGGSAPGTGHSYTVTLRVNGADTAVICAIANAATTCSDTTHTAAIGVGNGYDVKIVADNSADPAVTVLWSTTLRAP